ncbi:hypothetical protein MN608_00449 [Microdochium nivale]|nr:hypothetical protein MN608_00449 [Microdochium nivale]
MDSPMPIKERDSSQLLFPKFPSDQPANSQLPDETSRAFPFFSLPAELREAILRHLVIFPYPPNYGSRPIPVVHRNQHPNTSWMDSRGELYPMNLLLTCKQMHQEALKAWRLFNTFVWVVKTTKSDCVNSSPLTGRDLDEMMEIQHLMVHIVHVVDATHLEDSMFPLVRSMIEQGNLKDLAFEIDINFHARDVLDIFFPSYTPHRKQYQRGDWDIHDYTPTAAMRSLLDLLSHHLLKSASLRIDWCLPEHPASRWCPLHDYATADETVRWGVPVKWREFNAACSAISDVTEAEP